MGGEDEMKGKERKRMRLIGRKNPKMEKDLQNFVRIFFLVIFLEGLNLYGSMK